MSASSATGWRKCSSDRINCFNDAIADKMWQGIFFPESTYSADSFSVCTPPCAVTCFNICAHIKDPVVHVRVWWIMATHIYPACTITTNNQLDDCGRSTERWRKEEGKTFLGFADWLTDWLTDWNVFDSFMATHTYPARTIMTNNQLDDCGRSTERRSKEEWMIFLGFADWLTDWLVDWLKCFWLIYFRVSCLSTG